MTHLTDDDVLRIEGLLSVLDTQIRMQPSYGVGADYLSTARKAAEITRDALATSATYGQKAASVAWTAAEQAAYNAINDATEDMQAVLQQLRDEAGRFAGRTAAAIAHQTTSTLQSWVKDAVQAAWTTTITVVKAAVPWVLLGGGVLLFLLGGPPGWLLGGASVLGGLQLAAPSVPAIGRVLPAAMITS